MAGPLGSIAAPACKASQSGTQDAPSKGETREATRQLFIVRLLATTDLIVSSNESTAKGLTKKATAPATSHRCRIPGSSCAVAMIVGILNPAPARRDNTSRPDIWFLMWRSRIRHVGT